MLIGRKKADSNLMDLVAKHNLQGKVDWRIDTNCREANAGEHVIIFVSIIEAGAPPTQPPPEFIAEAIPALRSIHQRMGFKVRFKTHPMGMTQAEIEEDKAEFSRYCERFHMFD